MDENLSVSGNVITDASLMGQTDFDVDNGDVFTVSNPGIQTSPNGTLELNSDGSYNYLATNDALSLGEIVVDTFTYVIKDLAGATDTAELFITVTGVNDSPVAFNNATNVDENHAVIGSVIADASLMGDVDFDMDNGDIITVDNPSIYTTSNGILTLNPDGSYNYLATNDHLYEGELVTDTFSYVVKDLLGATDTAELFITVNGVNDTPVATDNALNILENQIISGNVILDDNGSGTDYDIDNGDVITILNPGNFTSPNGALDINSSGGYTYNHTNNSLSQGEIATDVFTYTVADRTGDTSSAELIITITGRNDNPRAFDNAANVLESQTVTGNVHSR